jgi:hypothetical protein
MPYRRVIVQRMLWVMPVALVMVVAGNWRSLREGVRYLWQMLTWRPSAIRPIAPDGPFGSCYDLVRGDNVARYQIITDTLRTIELDWEEIPVPQEAIPDLFVRFGPDGPATLFVAHYDKSRETQTYQGAADNTAAVSVLLAAAHDLATRLPTRPVAFLFSAAEERGLKGAQAFLDWSRHVNLVVAEVINLDMLGRDLLALRPSALPGFYFWLPLIGPLVHDGRRLRRGASYPLPDRALAQRLTALMGRDLVVYQRFTVYSDSNAFQSHSLPTVSVSCSNMYYQDLVWERDTDRVELLDERNLVLAHQLVTKLSTA